MSTRIVTFIGNREVYTEDNVLEQLLNVLEKYFVDANFENKTVFYCGAYGQFDFLAADAIDILRKKYPNASTVKIFVTPYITQSYKKRIDFLKKDYDEVMYPPLENVPPQYAIIRRNRWMIDNCDEVVAYVHNHQFNSGKNLAYALRKGKKINLLRCENRREYLSKLKN